MAMTGAVFRTFLDPLKQCDGVGLPESSAAKIEINHLNCSQHIRVPAPAFGDPFLPVVQGCGTTHRTLPGFGSQPMFLFSMVAIIHVDPTGISCRNKSIDHKSASLESGATTKQFYFAITRD